VKILLQVHKPAVVARLTAVSLSSVKRIAREKDVLHLDDAAERKRRRIGRPSKVRVFRGSVSEILEREPDIRSIDVLRRLRSRGYSGGKTALYALVASVRMELARADAERERVPAASDGAARRAG
jgi:hypothetical protein